MTHADTGFGIDPDAVAPARWNAEDLRRDTSWIVRLPQQARRDLTAAVMRAFDRDRALLDYRREEFDLGAAAAPLAAAAHEARRGRGLALVKGLPREGLDAKQFEVLTWAIGLHLGVGRPQGKATHYLSAVRDEGTNYRTTTGRGYSSNAELDFHTDSTDFVGLACYNQAQSGGMSIVSSTVSAHQRMTVEHPSLLPRLHQPIHFSRQGEQAPDEEPSYPHPVFDSEGGLLFSKWNRNRVQSAQKMDGVPRLDAEHLQALEAFDALVRRADLAYTMYLEPGDLQLLNSHVTLHSRTDFTDHEAPEKKRLLYRLWLATPDGDRLPQSWLPVFKTTEPGTVRGGILGQQHDDRCKAFEHRQAQALGMRVV
jgi:alpha-ketoglutarate-dependent taurine dioxygenase